MPAYTPAEMLSNAELLEPAAEFPDHEWTRQSYARNAEGEKVDYRSTDAVKFSAVGRLMRVSHDAGQPGSGRRYAAINRELIPGGPDLTTWNDAPKRNQEQVRRLFRRAAQRLRQQAAASPADSE